MEIGGNTPGGNRDMTATELSQALIARGIITEQQQLSINPPASNPAPWYVQVMMGVCAWIAGVLLLSFVVVGVGAVLFRGRDDWAGILVLGIAGCGGCAAIYALVAGTSIFSTQFALAMSIAGQFGIAIAFGEMGGERVAFWMMMVLELVLTVVVRNRLHRVLTSMGVVVAWALATHELLFGKLPGISISFSAPSPDVYNISALSVILWLIVWVPVACAGWWLVTHESQWMAAGNEELLRPVTHGLLAALSIAPLVTHPATFWMALGLGSTHELTDAAPGATALWPLLAMLLAVLAMALAFAIRCRPLIGLAIVFGLLEVSAFYYVLGTTLLVKSIIMVLLGAALLASAEWLAMEVRT